MSNLKYSKILSGKKVVLVGPSWHNKGSGQGKYIDSYDVVVRMNLGYRIPSYLKKDIGNRVDILYSSLGDYYFKNEYFTEKILKKLKEKVKCIVFTNQTIHKKSLSDMEKINSKANIPIHVVNKEYYKYLRKKCKKKLSCGIVTIYHLLQYDIKELYITGLTFYDTKTINKRKIYYPGYCKFGTSYSKRPFHSHDLNSELLFLKKFQNNDKRIKCDDVLTKIMKNNRVFILEKKIEKK